MRKISPTGVNLIILSILIICWAIAGISAYREHKQSSEPGQDGWMLDSNITNEGMAKEQEISEEIVVEIMSRDYLENREFLMRVEIDGDQIGIVYFNEHGKIEFTGNKERFEKALYKAFKLREEYWKYEKEGT